MDKAMQEKTMQLLGTLRVRWEISGVLSERFFKEGFERIMKDEKLSEIFRHDVHEYARQLGMTKIGGGGSDAEA